LPQTCPNSDDFIIWSPFYIKIKFDKKIHIHFGIVKPNNTGDHRIKDLQDRRYPKLITVNQNSCEAIRVSDISNCK